MSGHSKSPEMVALSTTEAKNMALTHAAHEGLCFQQLQVELRIDHEGMGVLLLCDNHL